MLHFLLLLVFALICGLAFLAVLCVLFWLLFESRLEFGREPNKVVLSVPLSKLKAEELNGILEAFIVSYLRSYDENKVVVYDIKCGGYDGTPHGIERIIDYGSSLYCMKAANAFSVRKGYPSFFLGRMEILVLSTKVIDKTVEIHISGNKYIIPYKVEKNRLFLCNFVEKLEGTLNQQTILNGAWFIRVMRYFLIRY